ncbi:hypothetical protein BSKO_02706 [Bryopsis sp. KO-2023]|nr:hypothetical protein BSKO_02706 [Bryopsis sp. KO-2023]
MYRRGLTFIDERMISHCLLATFIWDAHLNMMRCTGIFIALYLAKYLSKTEAFGSLDMDVEDVETVKLPSDVTIEDAQFPGRFFKDRLMGTSEVAVHIVKRTFDDIFHEFEHGKNNGRPLKEGPPEGVQRRTYGKLKTVYDLIIKGKEKGLSIERLEEKLRGFPNLNMINKKYMYDEGMRNLSRANENEVEWTKVGLPRPQHLFQAKTRYLHDPVKFLIDKCFPTTRPCRITSPRKKRWRFCGAGASERGGVSSYVRQAVLQVAELATQAMATPEPLPPVSRSKKPVIEQTIGYEDALFVTYTKTKTGQLKRRYPGRAKILVVEQGHRRFLAS